MDDGCYVRSPRYIRGLLGMKVPGGLLRETNPRESAGSRYQPTSKHTKGVPMNTLREAVVAVQDLTSTLAAIRERVGVTVRKGAFDKK